MTEIYYVLYVHSFNIGDIFFPYWDFFFIVNYCIRKKKSLVSYSGFVEIYSQILHMIWYNLLRYHGTKTETISHISGKYHPRKTVLLKYLINCRG